MGEGAIVNLKHLAPFALNRLGVKLLDQDYQLVKKPLHTNILAHSMVLALKALCSLWKWR
jgi:hypothetical protein